MAINLSIAPYFDDFDENKHYHKIVFKPGNSVQLRELTQSQTIIQDQIRKLGKFILSEGSRVSGAKIFLDHSTVAVKTEYTTDLIEDFENYLNLYVTGSVSKIVGKITKLNTTNGTIFVKPVSTSLYKTFEDGETLYIFPTKELALQSILDEGFFDSVYTTTVANGSIVQINTVTGNVYTQKLNSATPLNVQVGDQLTSNVLSNYYSVISISKDNIITVNKPLEKEIKLGDTLTVTKKSSKSVLEVGVTDGVFFNHGYFVKCPEQSFIPDENTQYPTCSVGFRYNETLKDYVDDTSLLDPAVKSTNYTAPGADRYVVLLEMTQKYISDTGELDLVADEKFIELIRLNQGKPVLINERSTLGELRHTLARQLFDHAGHFIIDPFKIQFSETELKNANTANLTIQISPGRAYFNGYEFELRVPNYLKASKPLSYEQRSNSAISMQQGSSLKVNSISGTLGVSNVSIVGLYKSTNTSQSNLIGTAEAKSYQCSGNNQYDLFLTNIKITKANCSIANVVSVANSPSSPIFKANSILLNGRSWVQDQQQGSYIFTMPGVVNNYNPGLSVVSLTVKTVPANAYISGTTIIADAKPGYKYLATGNVATQKAQIIYDVTALDNNGVYKKADKIPLTKLTTTANTTTSKLALTGTSYTGNVKVTAHYVIYNVQPRQKVDIDANCIVTVTDCNCACLWYSDIDRVYGVWEISANTFKGEWKPYTAYKVGDVVSRSYNVKIQDSEKQLYRCTANVANFTNFEPENLDNWVYGANVWFSLWEKETQAKDYKISNGQTATLYDHGRLYINSPGKVFYVGFSYMQHSAGDYISYNSYSTANVNSNLIYNDPNQGTFDLQNSLDFRPRRNDLIGCQCCLCKTDPLSANNKITNANTIIAPSLPNANIAGLGQIVYSGNFWLPRIDIVILNANKKFKLIEGVAKENPIPPKVPDGAMRIATIYYKAGVSSIKDIKIVYDTHRRYTMDDIGKLDKRISRVEYYNSLTLSEQSTLNKSKSDSLLSQRLSSGFLADSFEDYSIVDAANPEFDCLIDINDQCAKPAIQYNRIELSHDSDSSTQAIKNKLYYLPYIVNDTDAIVTKNEFFTGETNLNTFSSVNLNGFLTLFPSVDNWVDTVTKPDINIISGTVADTLTFKPKTTEETLIQNFKDSSTRKSKENEKNTVQSVVEQVSSKSTQTLTDLQENVIPFARSIPIQLKATGMVPYQKIYVYINDVMVNSYCIAGTNPLGEIVKLEIIEGGSDYSPTNTSIGFIGTNTSIAQANVAIVDGKVVGVDLSNRGKGYLKTTTTEIIGIGSGAKVVPYFNSMYGADLYTNNLGDITITLDLPNDEFLKFSSGELTITVCDHPTAIKYSKCKASAKFTSKGDIKTITKQNTITLVADAKLGTVNQTKFNTIPTYSEQTLPVKTDFVYIPVVSGNTVYSLTSKDVTIANLSSTITSSIYKIFKQDNSALTQKVSTTTPSTILSSSVLISDVKFDSSAYLTFNSNSSITIAKDTSNTSFYSMVYKTQIQLPDYVVFKTPIKLTVLDSNIDVTVSDIAYNLDANTKNVIFETNFNKSVNFSSLENVSKTVYFDVDYGIQCDVDTKNLQLYFDGLTKNLVTGNTEIVPISTNTNLGIVANNAVKSIEASKSNNPVINQLATSQNTFSPIHIEIYNKYVTSGLKIISDEQLTALSTYEYFAKLLNFFDRSDATKDTFNFLFETLRYEMENDHVSYRPDTRDTLIPIKNRIYELGTKVLQSKSTK